MADIEVEKIYEQYAEGIYNFLLGLTRDADTAEELTAETFYQALRSIERFDGTCKFQTWLFQIAKHTWYKEIDKRKRPTISLDVFNDVISDGYDLENHIAMSEQKLELYQRIQKLDPLSRDVIYLRLTGELSFEEIGQVLGKTSSWARVTFYRAKERIKNDEQ